MGGAGIEASDAGIRCLMTQVFMYTTDAIVLKKLDVGEADVLYMFYTRDYGKMRAVASGIRKEGAKLRGHLEPLSYSRIRFVRGKQREKLISASLLNFWDEMRVDSARLSAAHYIAGRIDQECMEGEQDEALWRLVIDSLSVLDRGRVPDGREHAFFQDFEENLSSVLGYGGETKHLKPGIIIPWANWMS